MAKRFVTGKKNALFFADFFWADKLTQNLPTPFIRSVLSSIKIRVFFERYIENKHMCCPDHNYFCKSKICVINSIADSRNMVKVSKNMSSLKVR